MNHIGKVGSGSNHNIYTFPHKKNIPHGFYKNCPNKPKNTPQKHPFTPLL